MKSSHQSRATMLRLKPLRFALMFTPIWILFGPSLYLYWDRWMADPVLMGLIGGMPVIAWALGELFLKDRWKLELSPKGLVHHTLVGEEVFDWQQMGPVSLKSRGPLDAFTAIVFAYPIDANSPQEILSKHMGRSILAIFGDGSGKQLAATIDAQRQAFSKRR